MGENTNTIKNNTRFVLEASKVVGLEINSQKTMYVVTSRYQSAGQNHSLLIVNKCFEHVAKVEYS
jgi:hypothetical protein